MPFPSPSRLDAFLRPYAGPRDLAVRVWGVDAGASPTLPPAMAQKIEEQVFGKPPRLVLLGAAADGLVVVRQTHDGFEDLDGLRVPWTSVVALEREPHLVRDLLRVHLVGRPPLRVAVSNHVLLPHNRAACKALCELLRSPPALEGRAAVAPPPAGPPELPHGERDPGWLPHPA